MFTKNNSHFVQNVQNREFIFQLEHYGQIKKDVAITTQMFCTICKMVAAQKQCTCTSLFITCLLISDIVHFHSLGGYEMKTFYIFSFNKHAYLKLPRNFIIFYYYLN